MFLYLGKVLFTAITIVIVAELTKRNMTLAAIVASLPIVSILSMILVYSESSDIAKVVAFSQEIVWLVLPSITLFILLPVLIRLGLSFYWSLLISMFFTVVSYFLFLYLKGLLTH